MISSDVAEEVSSVLADGVSGEGGAKNARVNGYTIAAKTGTSQKFDILDENGNSYLRIGSTVAYNIDESGGIACIIIVDEPQSSVKYGSVVAAPYVSALMSNILPYLEYRSSAEIERLDIPNLVGMATDSAKRILTDAKINYEIIGSGDTVLYQSPDDLDYINTTLGKVYLYTIEDDEQVSIPSLVGLSATDAASVCMRLGLNVSFSGSGNGGTVISQSLPTGARVKKGTRIDIKTQVRDYED